MSEYDSNETEVPVGLLEIDLDNMSVQQQFNSWMLIKNVGNTPKVLTSNILTNLLGKDDGKQNPYDLGKDAFDRGYIKDTFNKACV